LKLYIIIATLFSIAINCWEVALCALYLLLQLELLYIVQEMAFHCSAG
jgi:hypothetical protein